MMKALFLTIGNRCVASSRARVYSHIPGLQQNGWKVFVIPYTSAGQCRRIMAKVRPNLVERAMDKTYTFLALVLLCAVALFFNIIVIQKVALSRFAVYLLKALNPNLIIDFDDSIFMYQDISYLLEAAVGVIVSNEELGRFARRHNSAVYEVPTSVDMLLRRSSKDNGIVRIGWIGSPDTSRYLEQLKPVLKNLKGRFGDVRLEFMGLKERDCPGLSGCAEFRDWSIEAEGEYLRRLDIGIMPLTDDKWARGKGGYKLLQYMSTGAACVASPVGVNKKIIKNGINGFFAATTEEWTERLSALVSDASLRREIGRRGYDVASEFYSYRVNTPRLSGILRSCLKRKADKDVK